MKKTYNIKELEVTSYIKKLLLEKEEKAMSIIKKYAPKDEIYYIGYSGGKDSDVLLYLIRKMKKWFSENDVTVQVIHNFTSVGSREQITHVFKQKDVKVIYPKMTMFQLIEKYGFPTRINRWCCKYLKHDYGKGKLTIIGIRSSESYKRTLTSSREYKEFGFNGSKYFKNGKMKKSVVRSVLPIFDWSEMDVLYFIKDRNIDYCSLYDKGYTRTGCEGCPQTLSNLRKLRGSKKEKAYIGAYDKHVEYRKKRGLAPLFSTGEEAFEYWLSGKSIEKFRKDKEEK